MELSGPKETMHRARQLRTSMSLPERILWRALRGKQTGHRFRRQHPAGPYILDFYCEAARLCVEIDGQSHEFTSGRDARRDAWLARKGVRTVRVPAEAVFDNLEGVVLYIVEQAGPPPAGPPPALRATSP